MLFGIVVSRIPRLTFASHCSQLLAPTCWDPEKCEKHLSWGVRVPKAFTRRKKTGCDMVSNWNASAKRAHDLFAFFLPTVVACNMPQCARAARQQWCSRCQACADPGLRLWWVECFIISSIKYLTSRCPASLPGTLCHTFAKLLCLFAPTRLKLGQGGTSSLGSKAAEPVAQRSDRSSSLHVSPVLSSHGQ